MPGLERGGFIDDDDDDACFVPVHRNRSHDIGSTAPHNKYAAANGVLAAAP